MANVPTMSSRGSARTFDCRTTIPRMRVGCMACLWKANILPRPGPVGCETRSRSTRAPEESAPTPARPGLPSSSSRCEATRPAGPQDRAHARRATEASTRLSRRWAALPSIRSGTPQPEGRSRSPVTSRMVPSRSLPGFPRAEWRRTVQPGDRAVEAVPAVRRYQRRTEPRDRPVLIATRSE